MVAIILVNWNGYNDTIECLDSLQKCTEKNFFVVVCDNGSTNDSIVHIMNYCNSKCIKCDCVQKTDNKPVISLEGGQVILYNLGENNGFSRGNNLGIKFASMFNPDYYLLLNNDTIVEPDFLSLLVNFQKKNSQYKVLTPLIHYFYDKKLIWNGGGNMYWGFRIYHFADQHESVVPDKESISCTYITGCALFFVPELLDENNCLLSERFFYGEEDFEFGLRMKKRKIKMACVLKSIIYHKVGGSRKNNGKNVGFTYIHFLNRLINVRHFMPKWQYPFYKVALFLSVIRILIHFHHMSVSETLSFVKRLNNDSNKMDSVSKEVFLQAVKSEINTSD